jgi:hypothetical protein
MALLSLNKTANGLSVFNFKSIFFCKLIIYGVTKGLMSYEIRMNNKVGVAYGTATEVTFYKRY